MKKFLFALLISERSDLQTLKYNNTAKPKVLSKANVRIKLGRSYLAKLKLACLTLLILSFSLLLTTTASATTHIPGTVEGIGTQFQIIDSEYLNITLDSTDSVKLYMESIPSMVVFDIEADSATSPAPTSTQITLSGFATSTPYYLYEDSFENLTQFTTDTAGTYTYQQDITTPHLIIIQSTPGTKYIRDNATGGDCTLIGTWNNTTKTCTLTQDVLETVQISNNNITIDGANLYSIAGPGTGMGIYVPNLSNITIKNILITSFSYGVYNQNSSITIDNAQIKYNNRGINQNGTSLTLTNSEISNSGWTAVNLFSGTNTVNNNNIHDNYSSGVYTTNNVSSLDLNNNTFLNHQKPISIRAEIPTFTHSNNSSTGSSYNGIYLTGSFTSNQTLDSNDVPYILDSPVIVSGVTVTIKPDSIIKLIGSGAVGVYGTLNATSTAAQKIFFTSLKDDTVGNDPNGSLGDTNGDGAASSPTSSDWMRIHIFSGGTGNFDNVVVRYAGKYFSNAFYNQGGTLNITNSQIGFNSGDGVRQDSGSLNLTNSEIFNNTNDGIDLQSGTAIINNNSIHDNGSAGVYASSGINPNVQNNWWGDASGPYHATLNASGTGDSVNSYVTDFEPWLGYDPTQNQAPGLTNPNQYKSDGTTVIQEGNATNEKTVTFKATVSDPDNNQVKIEVELKEVDQSFDETNIISGTLVNPGQTSQATITNLTYGKYKWRIRAKDQNGASSQWQEFGMVGVMDFEMGVRDINVAVILAETSNRIYNASSTLAYYQDELSEDVKDYFCENSFGTRDAQGDCAGELLNFNFQVFADPNNNNQPYKLTQTQEYYGQEGEFDIILTDVNNNIIESYTTRSDRTTEYAWDVIKLANPNINYNDFDSVIVIYPGNYCRGDACLKNQYLTISPLALSAMENVRNLIAVAELRLVGSWAHELGHALGEIINNDSLCDLYPGINNCGKIGDWGLLGGGSKLGTNQNNIIGATPSHFSLFSKNRLNFLDFEDIITNTPYDIESLETMKLNDKAKKYDTSSDSYYILEPRTTNPQYSRWDVAAKREIVESEDIIPQSYDDALVIYGVVPSSTPIDVAVDIKSILKPTGSYEDTEYQDFENKVSIKTMGMVSDSQSFKIKTLVQPLTEVNFEGLVMKPGFALFNQLSNLNFPVTESVDKIPFVKEVNATRVPAFIYNDALMVKNIRQFLLKDEMNQTNKIRIYTDKTKYKQGDTVKVYVDNNNKKPVIVGVFPEGNLFRKIESGWVFVTYLGGYKSKGGVTKIIEPGAKEEIFNYITPESGRVYKDIRKFGSFRFALPYSFDLEKFDKWEDDFRETDPLLQIVVSPKFEVDILSQQQPKEQPILSPTSPTTTQTPKTPINILEDPTKTNQIYLTLLSALLLLISIVLRLNEKTSKKYSKLLNILIAIFTIVLIFSITKVMAKTDNQTSQTEQSASIAYTNNQTHTPAPASANSPQIISGQPTTPKQTQNNTQSYTHTEIPSDYTPTSPDLDLHAITPSGLHTGINYDTGEYENQIPGAKASGDMMFNNEWIFVPESTQVKYYVSSYDIEQFLTQNPDIANQLTSTQETYTLKAMYYDATSQKFESTPLVDQPIDPGQAIIHETTGTTDIQITPGIPDTTPPQTQINLTGTMGNNNYYVSDVTIDFTATDPAPTGQESTGVLKTKYSLNDGVTWDVYATSTPLIIDTEGTNTIQYKSTDRANNTEPTQTITLNIDKTAPTIFASDTSAEQMTEQGTYLDIQATAEDPAPTGTGQATLTSDIPLSQTFPPGTTDILLTSQDFAGNIATSTITVTIFSTPTADPDGDCVANQDDVKPFDSTIFANIILPQEYSYWEKEMFNYPFLIAGVGNVEMSFSDIYFEIEDEDNTNIVKDSQGNTIPITITNVDGITTISFIQNTKENTNYTLTIKTKKGNKKEKEKIKKKKDEEQDQEKKDELEKELKFVEAPITVKLTSNTCPNTLEVSSPINIYDKEKKAHIHYKYKNENNQEETQLILKSDDEIEIQRGQPMVFTVKVTNLPKNTPFSANISGNFTMIDTVIEEEHDDEKNKHRKEKKFSLFYPISITDTEDTITITLTVGSVTQTDTLVVKFKGEDND